MVGRGEARIVAASHEAVFTSGASQGNRATHIEGHAAAIMWQREFNRAVLIVDRAMCQVCQPGSSQRPAARHAAPCHLRSRRRD